MHKPKRTAGALWCLLLITACYDNVDPNAGSGGAEPCFDYANYVPYPDITFSVDVMPLLQHHCNDASCHGGVPSEAKAELWLGPPESEFATAEARQLVLSQLVGVRSLTEPNVGLVVRRKPGESFLMLKLDGCHNDPSFQCTPQATPISNQPCGDRMPELAAALSDTELDMFRSWIALGARND
jgi:hypothetical protein